MRSLVVILVILASSNANAAVVTKVLPQHVLLETHGATENFQPGEKVCLQIGGKISACGEIVKRVGSKAALRVSKKAKGLVLKEGATIALRGQLRSPASAASVLTSRQEAKGTSPGGVWNLSVGANGGLSYLYPIIHVESEIGDGLTVGAMPLFMYLRGSLSATTGFGGFATFGYYFGGNSFRKLGVLLGGGVYSLSLTYDGSTESLFGLAGLAQLQYRIALGKNSNWHIGINAGGQYVLTNNFQFSVSIAGLSPLASAYVGVRL